MKDNIELMNKKIMEYENLFYDRVIDLENSMNKCKCKKRNIRDFSNIKREIELLCLECGGYVEL